MSTPQTLSSRVAEEIRVLLVRRRTSARQLAAKVGLSQSAMSARLTGTTPLGLNELERIAEALDADPVELLRVAGRSDQRATRSSPASTAQPSANRPTPARICGGTIPRQADTTTANRRTHRTPPRRPAIQPWTHEGAPA